MTTRPGNPKSLSTKRFSSERSARGLSVWKYFLQAAIQPLAMSLCAMEENRIKEFHDGMQIGRTSCSNFLANTFRVLLTAAAYVLIAGDATSLVSDAPRPRASIDLARAFSKTRSPSHRLGASHCAALASSVSAFIFSPWAWAFASQTLGASSRP